MRGTAVSGLEHHFVVPFERSFDAAYGLEFVSATVGRVTVREELLGADGTVASGVYAAIAESLASTGTAVEVVPDGLVPVRAEQRHPTLSPTFVRAFWKPPRECRARGELRVDLGRRDRSAGRQTERDRDRRDRRSEETGLQIIPRG